MNATQFKERRILASLTQESLAELLDISTRQVKRYESGACPVPHVVKLALDMVTEYERIEV